ncbi:hypothetical protein VP01_5725g1 [Puccinia sorghi]|uniref:Uncharacterized protein n=1 Tax=Puccinia sorghi TaxID=27349 RepID=A0A0L6UJB9_9BASI|nr:hypothetical protein VP01_5725g1 [Puccinia sorghi]
MQIISRVRCLEQKQYIQTLLAAALKKQSDELQSQLAARDEVISKLMQKTPGKSHSHIMKQKAIGTSQPKCSPANKGKASTSKGLGTSKSDTPTGSDRPSPQTTPASRQKCAVTPKTSSPKANPFPMVSKDMPESFTATRDALYTHIKLIWNLLEQKAIPSPPHPSTLREFASRFSNFDEILKTAKDTNAASLIPIQEVVTLKNLQKGQKVSHSNNLTIIIECLTLIF